MCLLIIHTVKKKLSPILKNFNKSLLFILFVSVSNLNVTAQVILNADNIPNNTYELINSVFVRSGSSSTAVEAPDQIGISGNSSAGSHTAFGRHISEVFDATLNKNVFAFYAHLNEDNDVSTTSTDRQRTEIKTFGSSPDNLKGVLGEIVRYKWRFKIPAGWKPSSAFTHIHQVKAVDGDDSDPLYTLTLRKGTSGSPSNKFELIYDAGISGVATKLLVVDLSIFEGIWVEATETMTIGIGANGTYEIDIKRISDGVSIFSFSDFNRETKRADNSFIRPKWGIYRSIATPSDLRDEVLYFSDFSIEELSTLPLNFKSFTANKTLNAINLNWNTASENGVSHFDILAARNDANFTTIGKVNAKSINQKSNYQFLDRYPILGNNYYKINALDFDGKITSPPIIQVNYDLTQNNIVFPNPVKNDLNIQNAQLNDVVKITDLSGKTIQTIENKQSQSILNIDVKALKTGIYQLQLIRNGIQPIVQTFIKE